jgi:hypothetical protein
LANGNSRALVDAEASAVTQQSACIEETRIEAELDRLTYLAYLLTLDPAQALSVVLTALDWYLEKPIQNSDLQRRTVELLLRHLQNQAAMDAENECPPYDAVLHDDSQKVNSKQFSFSEDDMGNKPIVALDSGSRIAFVLHHVLGYTIEESALLADMDVKGFRAQLRSAYVQLVSGQLGRCDGHLNEVLAQSALV